MSWTYNWKEYSVVDLFQFDLDQDSMDQIYYKKTMLLVIYELIIHVYYTKKVICFFRL